MINKFQQKHYLTINSQVLNSLSRSACDITNSILTIIKLTKKSSDCKANNKKILLTYLITDLNRALIHDEVCLQLHSSLRLARPVIRRRCEAQSA